MSNEIELSGFNLTLADVIGADVLLDTTRCFAYNLREKVTKGAFNYKIADDYRAFNGAELNVSARKSGRGLVGGPLLRWDSIEFGLGKRKRKGHYYNVRLPDLPGCYVIFIDRILVYVVSSDNISSRVYVHFKNISWRTKERFSNHHWLVKFRVSERLGDYLMWEARLIHRLEPPFNKRKLRSLKDAIQGSMF